MKVPVHSNKWQDWHDFALAFQEVTGRYPIGCTSWALLFGIEIQSYEADIKAHLVGDLSGCSSEELVMIDQVLEKGEI